jgi:Radical SAM superfamily
LAKSANHRFSRIQRFRGTKSRAIQFAPWHIASVAQALGRGCPYGCEFCTVTGFFGDSIRFRTNESVVNELMLLKARAEGGLIAVFFIDDNFAINVKRTKSLLRDIIAANAQVHWVAQISANLLRDEELVALIAAAGGKWIFIGMESIDSIGKSLFPLRWPIRR